jgi:hypothetical protein
VRHVLAALLAFVFAAEPAHAAASWRLEQPPQPTGMPYPVPLGAPGDLKLLSPSRGLLTVTGNAVVPKGVFTWDGRSWRSYMTVCGGTTDAGVGARIAVASASEFWVIADPAKELQAADVGTTLCHVRDGAIVASHAARLDSPDAFAPMDAAACASPASCAFGGIAVEGGDGRSGAFHRVWDGAALTGSLNTQARGVSDVEPFAGELWESSFVGPGDEVTSAPSLLTFESQPLLLRRLLGGTFLPDPYAVPVDAELLALDAGDDELWAAGGGRASGAGVPARPGLIATGPLLLRRHAGTWAQVPVPVASGPGSFAAEDRFVDVAAVPGTDTAWVAVERFTRRRDPYGPARVVLLDAAGSVLEDHELPADGAPRGTAARIDCAAVGECWLATYGGWLFHLTDGTPLPLDESPAFAGTLTVRPDDARTPQRILDTLPEDDSQRFAPPPEVDQPEQRARRPPRPLITKVTVRVLGRHRIELRFRLARRARVGVVGRRHGRRVAQAALRTLRPGRRAIELRVDPRRWPTSLRFTTRELRR